MRNILVVIVVLIISFFLSGLFKERKARDDRVDPWSLLRKRLRRAERDIRRLKSRPGFVGHIVQAVCLVLVVVLVISFIPVGPVRAITVERDRVSVDVHLGPELEPWAKENKVDQDYFAAVTASASIPRDPVTGRPASSGGTKIDVWTVYAVFSGENYAGWEGEEADPRVSGSWGEYNAWNALGVRFTTDAAELKKQGYSQEKIPAQIVTNAAELKRQRDSLEKILAQECLQQRYPGLSKDNCHGSVAGACGRCQGMPWQLWTKMENWVRDGG